jgi:hypothetical protein
MEWWKQNTINRESGRNDTWTLTLRFIRIDGIIYSDRQAIAAIQAAILSPSSYPLIECEFPPLQALNKLGDGSFKSANMVDNANLQFCSKLVNSIVPPFSFPTTRPKSYLLTSSTATSTFVQTARTVLPKSCAVMPMSASTISELLAVPNKPDLCVLVAPSVTQEYAAAHALASRGLTVVLVNGLAKVTFSKQWLR